MFYILQMFLKITTALKNLPQIYVSTSDPDAETGKDGDVWIKYE